MTQEVQFELLSHHTQTKFLFHRIRFALPDLPF